jgi:hypothetical protein
MRSTASYLTTAKIAERYSTTQRQICSWIAAGLPAVNISVRPGKPRWRVSPDDLQQWLEAKSAPVPVPTRRRRRKLPQVTAYF